MQKVLIYGQILVEGRTSSRALKVLQTTVVYVGDYKKTNYYRGDSEPFSLYTI